MDPIEEVAKSVAEQALDTVSPFRFCKVTVSSPAGTPPSVTIDYGGTLIVIPKTQFYCSVFPIVNDWVCVGINGNDRFILGRRLP